MVPLEARAQDAVVHVDDALEARPKALPQPSRPLEGGRGECSRKEKQAGKRLRGGIGSLAAALCYVAHRRHGLCRTPSSITQSQEPRNTELRRP